MNFVVSEVPYGDYIVVVFRDLQILRVQRFSKTVQNIEFSLDLGAQSPEMR